MMVNYPNNPTVGQRFTLPSGVVMECAEAGTTPIWQVVPALDIIVLYLDDDDLSVTLAVGQNVIVGETSDSVTLALNANPCCL